MCEKFGKIRLLQRTLSSSLLLARGRIVFSSLEIWSHDKLSPRLEVCMYPSHLLNNIPQQSLCFMEFLSVGAETLREQFKPVLKKRVGGKVIYP